MPTYSFGTAPTDAQKLQTLSDVLTALPDNTSKLISPKDVRDAVYTLWENIMFKPTMNSVGTEYIGIDKADFREKILIGKKTVNNISVLSNNLLSNSLTPEVDVFFYNTKVEPQSNFDTTVAFLAGTSSNSNGSNLTAPYLRSYVVSNPPFANTLDFEVRNSSYFQSGLTGYGGNISIKSDKGFVYINGVRLPSYDSYINNPPQNGHILKYKVVGLEPTAFWEAPVTFSSVTDIINPTGTVSITGFPVILNGLPINFTDDLPTPVDIGGIPAGSTFSNVPVTEMIRRILYPYIRPYVTSSFNYSLIEINDVTTAQNLQFSFTVYRNATYSLSVDDFYENGTVTTPFNLIVPYPIPIPNPTLDTYVVDPGINVSTLFTGPGSFEFFTYSVVLSDTYPTTIVATSSLSIVLPWFYGTSTVGSSQSSSINTILGSFSTPQLDYLTPLLADPVLVATSSYNKVVELSTIGLVNGNQGYIYFGYPSDYPDLFSIRDSNGYIVFNNFNLFTVSNVTSPNGFWIGKEYKFYIFVGATGSTTPLLTTVGVPPDYNATYSFEFA